MSREDLLDRLFRLTYKHSGSGTNLTLSEVLELDWGDMEWWLERLDQERSAEAEAIKRSNSARRPRR